MVDTPLSLEQVVQNINNIAQSLNRLITSIEDGTGLIWQPYNSLLTSVAALQATMTANDLIVGSGAGTVARLAEGATGTLLGVNAGGNLAYMALSLFPQIFTSDGTYTPTTGMVYCIADGVGGGGGGGGVASSSGMGGGGGGGGGGYSWKIFSATTIGASKAVDIGAGGTGGASGANDGTDGADMTLGTTLLVAKGGSKGSGAAANNSGTGGAGGVAGTGDMSVPGERGQRPPVSSTVNTPSFFGARGGSSLLGYGGVNTSSQTNGAAGQNYGGGGAGGVDRNSGGNVAGGNGAPGILRIWELVRA